MTGKEVSLRNIFQDDNNAVAVEITQGLMGVDYENNQSILKKLTENLPDAIIGSPGMGLQNPEFFTKKESPALIVRSDYSNYKLDENSAYPNQKFRHVEISNPTAVSKMGGSAILVDLFFGVDDRDTAEDIQRLQSFVTEADGIGLPVIANIVAIGKRVDERNFREVVGLGARTCVEIGADVVCIPHMSVEEDAIVIEGIPNTDVLVRIKSAEEVSAVAKLFSQIPNRYKGIVIDSFTSAEQNFAVKDALQSIHK